MNKADLITAIEAKRGSTSYSIWYIGITDDPARRKAEHETEKQNTTYWKDWHADTEAIARDIEQYFLKKGMHGGTGGGEHPTYVYMF